MMSKIPDVGDKLEDGDGLLDWPHLQSWIADSAAPGNGPVVASQQLSGGTQNNLFLLRREDGTEMVLRRPPRHPRPNSNKTMLKEARVLSALSGSGVPHPDCFVACEDPGIIGSCFYLMAVVDGFNPAEVLTGQYLEIGSWQHDLGLSMIDAIVALARVVPDRVGLGDLGRPVGWIERQVPRWRNQLQSYETTEGYAGPALPEVERISDWLETNRPNDFHCGLIHGDFHLANVLAHPDTPSVAAVVDWELATLGDPRLDLGWLLATSQASGFFATRATYFPDWQELVSHYGNQSDLPLDDLAWWWTLACYKLGIILEGTHARSADGRAPAETGKLLHGQAVRLFEQAHRLVDGSVL